MRFLKKKIERYIELKKAKLEQAVELKPKESSPKSLKEASSPIKSPLKQVRREILGSPSERVDSHRKASCENIIKNYGRAMANFALSSISLAYLQPILVETGSNLGAFQSFVKKKKKSVNCIKKLREMLPLEIYKNVPNFAERKAFQALCVVFLKYFSVNWLFSSKIDNKPTHLAFRFKILRRVKDPDHFTYLKDFRFEKSN